MPVLRACPLKLSAQTLDLAELNSRTIKESSVLQINVLDISAIITLIT
jgi:hypothetical protein